MGPCIPNYMATWLGLAQSMKSDILTWYQLRVSSSPAPLPTPAAATSGRRAAGGHARLACSPSFLLQPLPSSPNLFLGANRAANAAQTRRPCLHLFWRRCRPGRRRGCGSGRARGVPRTLPRMRRAQTQATHERMRTERLPTSTSRRRPGLAFMLVWRATRARPTRPPRPPTPGVPPLPSQLAWACLWMTPGVPLLPSQLAWACL